MSIANLFCRKEINKLTIIPSHPSHDHPLPLQARNYNRGMLAKNLRTLTGNMSVAL